MPQEDKDKNQKQPTQKPSQAEGATNPGENTTQQPPKPSQAEGEKEKTDDLGMKKS